MSRNHNTHTGPIFRIRPMLVDNMLNMALALIYFIFAMFGLIGSTIDTIPPLYQVAGEIPSRILGAVVFMSGLVAGTAALHGLVNRHWERWEFYSTATLVTFMAVHVAALFYLAIGDDPTRLTYAVVSLSFLVMPTWKIIYILKKNK